MGGDTGQVSSFSSSTSSMTLSLYFCRNLNQVVRALIGFAYPSYQSLQVAMVALFIINILKRQAAMTDDPEDDLQWLRYWVVLATVHMIELVFVILITNMFLLECSSIIFESRNTPFPYCSPPLI